MSKLVNLISPFKEQQFRSVLEAEPEFLIEKHNGWTLLEWCRKYGNVVAEIAVLRFQKIEIGEDKLFDYLNYISDQYLSSQLNIVVVDSLWEAIINNNGILKISDEFQIDLPEGQVKDIEYIFECLNISNKIEYQNIVSKI